MLGAIIKLTRPDDDETVWEANQTDLKHHSPVGSFPDRVDFNWSLGPVKVAHSFAAE